MTSQSVSLGPKLHPVLNDVLGGGAASVLNITFGLSYALLIFAGRSDYTTPTAPVLAWYRRLSAPSKRWVWGSLGPSS